MRSTTKCILSFLAGGALGAGALFLLLPPTPGSVALEALADFSQRAAERRAEAYREAQAAAAEQVAGIQNELRQAESDRRAAEKKAGSAEKKARQAEKEISRERRETEQARQAVAEAEKVAAARPDKIEAVRGLSESQGNYIATLHVQIQEMDFALEAERGVVSTQKAFSRQLLGELDLSKQATRAMETRFELAEERVRELSGRRLRSGPGVTVGAVRSRNGQWSPGVAVGLTISWGG